MANYMADRIIRGVYTYEYVMSKRPDLKDEIDQYLIEHGHADLIPGDKPTVLPID